MNPSIHSKNKLGEGTRQEKKKKKKKKLLKPAELTELGQPKFMNNYPEQFPPVAAVEQMGK